MRVQMGGAYIPPVARHTYYKRLEAPTEDMFDELHVIKGFPLWKQLGIPKEYYYSYNLTSR